ncbi:hypothetical protein ES707_19091 [subsurface metagenome]
MWYKLFRVTGIANQTVFDGGLVSTIDEPKTLKAIIINVSNYNNNSIEGWIETRRILQIPDDCLSTIDSTNTATYYRPTNKMFRIPIDEVIKPGSIFKIAIKCGAALTNIDGSYEYEPTP